MIDVVTRDEDDQLVRDLQRADFEVYEDGVPQHITSFEVVGHTHDDGTPADSVVADRGIPPAVVALVFEELGPEARALAHRAALGYVDEWKRPADFAAVFTIDPILRPIVRYTMDANVLREAIRKAVMRPGRPLSVSAGDVPGAEHRDLVASTNAGDGFRAGTTADGLLGVVESLRRLPGRKVVLLFSEGIGLAPDSSALDRLWHVIELANQSSVTFYTVDASGLRASSTSADSRRRLRTYTAELGPDGKGREELNPASVLLGEPYAALGILAKQTGGALISETNDLGAAVRRVGADLRYHYLLGYSPTNQKLDGTFRNVDIRVRRAGVRVFARKGYRAIPGFETLPMRSYEVAPLLLLDQQPHPVDFEFALGTLRFPDSKHIGRTILLAEVPNGVITYSADRRSGQFNAALSVLARLKRADGFVVQRQSAEYRLSGPLERLGQSRQGQIVFGKEFDIPTGRHVLEVIAYDPNSRRASTRALPIDGSQTTDTALHLSEILLLRRAVKGSDDPALPVDGTALRFGEWVLIPYVGEPVVSGDELRYAFALMPDKDIGGTLRANVRLILENRDIMATEAQLGSQGRNGRIEYIGRIPISGLSPGTYRLVVQASSGGLRQVQTQTFVLRPRG